VNHEFVRPLKEEVVAELHGMMKTRLLARNQFASGSSCDRPTRSRFSVVFLGPEANAELINKFHIALLCMLHISPPSGNFNIFAIMQPFKLGFPFKFNLHATPTSTPTP
jgi:hypothetical protein